MTTKFPTHALTLGQVLKATGVSTTTMDHWRRGTPTKSALPVIKQGHNVFVDRDVLTAWASEHGVKLVKSEIKSLTKLAAPAPDKSTSVPVKSSKPVAKTLVNAPKKITGAVIAASTKRTKAASAVAH